MSDAQRETKAVQSVWRRALIIPGALVGIGVFLLLASHNDPNMAAREPAPLAVRVVTVAPSSVTGSAEGFGRVRAVRRWHGVSEVDGRIVDLADALTEGAFLSRGTVYAKIDPRDFEIAKGRATAALKSAQAALAEIVAREEAARANLALEERIEALARADLTRKRNLVTRGTNAQITVDESERDLVNQVRKVQELKNELALYAVQRVSAQATIKTSMLDLEDAERDLAHTVLRVPFDARVATEALEVGEYVRSGDSLAEFDDVAAADITVEVQPAALRALATVATKGTEIVAISVTDPSAVDAIIQNQSLSATVHQQIGTAEVEWPARVLRSDGSIDETTGTVGVIVRVEDPYGRKASRTDPPLTVGTFARTSFRTPPIAGILSVPREAIRHASDGSHFVYVAEANDTLGRRDIVVAAPVSGGVMISRGLEAGDRVLLSSPQPPVLGMPLRPIVDNLRVASR